MGWVPCLSLASSATLWGPLFPPTVPCQPQGSPTCPWHLPAARGVPARRPPAGGVPAEPLSSVSSLEVHFDLLDLTELTDMSDQELAEVFADSDEENAPGEGPAGERSAAPRPPARPSVRPPVPEPSVPAGLQPQAVPRAGYLRSPSWTRAREQGRDKKHLSDPELPPAPPDAFLPAERPREP